MKAPRRPRAALVASVLLLIRASALATAQTPDWSGVDRALGRAGAANPGGVYKFSFPRSDLHVTVNGVAVRPGLALGSWVAFKRIADGTSMAMGDLVLTPDEVPKVMARLQAGGVEQSALHNHLLGETPRVMYMHIMAKGDAAKIAQTIRGALEQSATPLAAPAAGAPPVALALDTVRFASILGATGKGSNGVYQIGVPRPETIREGGEEIPPAMGLATSINIQPTTGGRVVATGDFVLLPAEVNPVLRALKANDIAVTALHSHLMMDQPHVLFMHFWADGDAAAVARGLRAALDATAMAPAARK
jgi:hypothetical protein